MSLVKAPTDMDLPVFRYHPDPIASGSIVASGAQCVCCDQRRGFIYTGPSYCEAELDEALCPWCIADGSAHETFDASFVDEALFPDEIPREVVEEIAFRTPGFSGWQQEQWMACCCDAAAFIEPAGHAEIRARHPQLEGTLMMHIVHDHGLSGGAATRFLTSLNRDRGPTAYVFCCRHCDSKLAYIDCL
ncbi:CbrC family protein [Bradyrhizobium sp. CCGUVB1N3]|uniref:CbrC family protein n=1 Tax=Bradyrhizobium sp. CCGUVB1N3 TaxID=2949629 RepID=UPI0020B281F1|nr:CbrC family protein [Bradyrhizobium sp. CCGUVB1N3]MCP3477328.1 CbrC family protein [Bradyrhizobium sp. CCGUVB1N3]